LDGWRGYFFAIRQILFATAPLMLLAAVGIEALARSPSKEKRTALAPLLLGLFSLFGFATFVLSDKKEQADWTQLDRYLRTEVIADARISESSVTQHEAALSIAASQLTSGSLSIDLIPSADRTYNIGNEDYRWNQIHADIDGAILFRAKNDSGGVLSVGDVVYISGSTGAETPDVDLAVANDAAKMPAFGVISIGGNDGAEVHVTTFGSVLNVDLPSATYAVGDEVFVSTTAGEFTNTAPTGESSALQKIGYVTRVNPGGGPGGTLKVMGAGRTNAVPNLNEDKIFLGNASNQSVSTAISTIDVGRFNDDGTYLTSAPVDSVNGATGVVVLSGDDLAADHTATNYTATNSSGNASHVKSLWKRSALKI